MAIATDIYDTCAMLCLHIVQGDTHNVAHDLMITTICRSLKVTVKPTRIGCDDVI